MDIVVGILVIAAIGFIAYRFYERRKDKEAGSYTKRTNKDTDHV